MMAAYILKPPKDDEHEQAPASSTGSQSDGETSAATDMWDILARRLVLFHYKLEEGLMAEWE